MGQHAAPRRPLVGTRTGAVLLGALYGLACGLLDHGAGASSARALTVGVVAGVVAAVVALAVGRRLPVLPRVPRAVVTAACAGAGAAFLVALSDGGSTARAISTGVLLAVAVGVATLTLSTPPRRR
ncbi:hypothetical protein [Streptomyces spiramenti]|uniref:Integral membrane protein n=1 Tax=Streptomyces spiramenti TaxID=2720606 RepID=A0ABX1AKF1_9ACTN|nr:hypothetical protein [Streptomyces spiramenti]NJP66730.1 hypothetical protein [Streptomyces spiramenti]